MKDLEPIQPDVVELNIKKEGLKSGVREWERANESCK